MSLDYEQFLKEKYNKVVLNVQEVAEELSITPRMVANRVRACSAEIPQFKRVGGRTLFPIKKVAYFLEHGFIEVL
jgi:hypothetical protein